MTASSQSQKGLKPYFSEVAMEAGCDEAGRGCLAGPVVAAAVILPAGYDHPLLNDSKKLSSTQRDILRKEIETHAVAWQVSMVDVAVIDEINILNASFTAMHQAIAGLSVQPDLLLIDGNRFPPYMGIPHHCIVKGDATYQSIAAASILAKTHRDAYMLEASMQYPAYKWDVNKGYGTKAHRAALHMFGMTPLHRKTFKWSYTE